MSATLLPSPCKRTTGRPSPPHRRPLHTLRKECDGRKTANNNHHSGFNPRTPCRVRLQAAMCDVLRLPFQSTHSLRSATRVTLELLPLSPVSIHALLTECDRNWNGKLPGWWPFQSTHSLRSATGITWTRRFLPCCFNPRTPYGVRPSEPSVPNSPFQFQSTHSLRSATHVIRPCWSRLRFQSTHSLRSATSAGPARTGSD